MSPYRARAAAGAAIILGLQAMAGPALAHHGWGSYDSTKVTTLEGTVQSVSFGNPHASIQLNSQGKVWFIVLAPPSRMSSRGLPDGTLKAGQTVSLDGYIHKSDPVELRAERIRVDGKSVELR
jgi:2,4-dienoyl-CoA reductase-like NADH-dependent reductase (Old Yellow Enzyme family)